MYPESKVRVKLWKTWLPDIFLNPHGYPAHEWVQMFSEYAAWVRNRVTEARVWHQSRGSVTRRNYLLDQQYHPHKKAAFYKRWMMTATINAAPPMLPLHRRPY